VTLRTPADDHAPRTTISDIAKQAGLSIGAVSYALNNKPGVSSETRTRVKRIARQMGWTPNQAARSLSRSQADAIGLVLLRPARLLAVEPFYMEFIAGMERAIAPEGIAILLHVLDDRDKEIETYEKWWAQLRVDGVLLVDMSREDPRVDAIKRIGIPAVCVTGDPTAAGNIPTIWTSVARPAWSTSSSGTMRSRRSLQRRVSSPRPSSTPTSAERPEPVRRTSCSRSLRRRRPSSSTTT
jgi:hypothetical protein